jgi:pimeloyl-ACP methyl ester carboxylesterase
MHRPCQVALSANSSGTRPKEAARSWKWTLSPAKLKDEIVVHTDFSETRSNSRIVARHERNSVDDLRGASRLAIDAITGVTALVEAMHNTIASGPDLLDRPLERPTRLVTGLVYGAIRGVTELVGASIDTALGLLAGLLGASAPRTEHEAVLAALNGVLGDYLAETRNPLAIEMQLRQGGRALELERNALRLSFPSASRRLLILVHGSCMNDLQWNRRGHDHGAALARDLGLTPLYLHYNSGLHISSNGRELALLLERLASEWPAPLEEIVLVGHSMGGLVSRSACHYGDAAGHVWRKRLRALVCLGSPHHGTPLERAGNSIDVLLGAIRYSAPLARLGKIRSAGVTDMRFGSVLDEHWQGRDRFAIAVHQPPPLRLPDDVDCYAFAATLAPDAAAKPRGDGLVPVDSALGRHENPEHSLAFPTSHQWTGFGMGHLDLLDRPEVYAKLRAFLGAERSRV